MDLRDTAYFNMNHIEDGDCPQVKDKHFNPVDPECYRCATKHGPTTKTTPTFYVYSVNANGELCLPLEEKLRRDIVSAIAD